MKVLLTGAAGFIGAAFARRLLDRGDQVLGLDNLSNYYDIKLKKDRLNLLDSSGHFEFERVELSDAEALGRIFSRFRPEGVAHLAAQAGVRYSLTHPHAYLKSNIEGFLNILENSRSHKPRHLLFASSSSVYGANRKLPFSVDDSVDHPVSLYAVTKKANELMAHSYSHLYRIPTTGLRFFTVYGPWGRPDMSIFRFTEAILKGNPIELYNQGEHRRDFTFIDDVIECLVKIIDKPATGDPKWDPAHPKSSSSNAPYRLYNIGSHSPVDLQEMLEVLEKALGKKAIRKFTAMQPGDVLDTFADVKKLKQDFGYSPNTPLNVGIQKFVEWYRSYFNIPNQ